MRRLSIRKQSESVTLFPFLAVLICTMGSLIVLLVLVVKQADVHAKEKVDQQAAQIAEEQTKLESEREHEGFRHQMLRDLRPKVTERLANHRAELGYLEQNLRDLHAEAQRIERQLARLEDVENAKNVDLRSEREKLDIVRAEIAKTQQEVDEAKKKAEAKPRSFAIIPYDGDQGTRRRPIYIECTKHGIIIQPEGIVIGPEDLKPPLIPGNPLDAALLATREHLDRVHGDRAGNPYPLLIVRPDGTEAYQYARAAMTSWDDEFGYELIDEDMPLAFPPADPNLAKLLHQTIADARRRHAILAAAQPTRFRSGAGGGAGSGGGSYGLRASPNGGFVMESLDGLGTVSSSSSGASDDFRRQLRGGTGGNDAEGEGFGRGYGDGPGEEDRSRDAFATAGTSQAERRGFNSPNGGYGDQQGADSQRGDSADQHGTDSQHGERTNAANGFAGSAPSDQQSQGTSSQGNSSQTGFGQPNGDPAGNSGFSGDSRSFGGASSGVPGNSMPQSLAGSHGADWALPQKAPGAIAILRPIRMLCFADHLVITTSRFSNQNSSIVNFDGRTSSAINDLTSKVWTHMEGWGIAGRNAYWKPEIRIEVAPRGEPRFREIEALMQNSGFEIQKVAQ
jgi:hypothetical protein